MVRITECFECGAKEKDTKLILNPKGPILCDKCFKKIKNKSD